MTTTATGPTPDAWVPVRVHAPRRSTSFSRRLDLAGCSSLSSWGFDPQAECFWAELWPVDPATPPVRIGTDRLVTTVEGIARAVAAAWSVPAGSAFLALTAPRAVPARRAAPEGPT